MVLGVGVVNSCDHKPKVVCFVLGSHRTMLRGCSLALQHFLWVSEVRGPMRMLRIKLRRVAGKASVLGAVQPLQPEP